MQGLLGDCTAPPAVWSLHPARDWGSAPAVEVSGEGRLRVGDGGERWLQRGTSMKGATTLLPENLVGALISGSQSHVVGASATDYRTDGPLGACRDTRRAPWTSTSTAAGREAIVSIDHRGQTWRSHDFGGLWEPITDLPQANANAEVVMNPDGAGFWWDGAASLWTTEDDARHWERVLEPRSTRLLGLASTPEGALVGLERRAEPRSHWGAIWRPLGAPAEARGGLDPRILRSEANPPQHPTDCHAATRYAVAQEVFVTCIEPAPQDRNQSLYHARTNHEWERVTTLPAPGARRLGAPLWFNRDGFGFIGSACDEDCQAPYARWTSTSPFVPLPQEIVHWAFDSDAKSGQVWSVGTLQADHAVVLVRWSERPPHLEIVGNIASTAPGELHAALGVHDGRLTVILSGDPWRVYRSRDGGAHWQQGELPLQASRVALSGRRGLATTRTGELYESGDAAQSWSRVPAPSAAVLHSCDPTGCWFDRGRRSGWQEDEAQ